MLKFCKSVFSGVKFRAKFEVTQHKQFLSVAANYSKSDFSTVKWEADSEETRQVYSIEIPSNIATIREGNSTAIDSFFYLTLYREWLTGLPAITKPNYKQPNKHSQLQKIQLNLLTATFLAFWRWIETNLPWLVVYGSVKSARRKINDYRQFVHENGWL